MAMDELAIIEWLRERTGGGKAAGARGIGDDMAVVDTPGGTVLFSSDMLLDGRHFDTTKHPYEAIGRKAINCCLSDCAAMAVQPLATTVSVALSEAMTDEQTKALMEGMLSAAAAFDVNLVGGDTTRWSSPLAIDVAVVAAPHPGIDPITRFGAKVGDGLFVTGRLGGSGLGRHLDFTPRITEAMRLAQSLGESLHAMIDISDGLSLDLWRLCQASGVGATLWEVLLRVLVSQDAKQLADQDGTPPLTHLLTDGEDFELLLAVAGDRETLARCERLGVPILPIGTITEKGLALEQTDGNVVALEPKGFVH